MAGEEELVGQKTIAVPERLAVDVSKLQAYCEAEVPGFGGTLSLKKFGQGQSNPTYLLSTDARQQYVMRKQPPGKHPRGAHAVDREAKVIGALGRDGFPVPEIHALCTDASLLGGMFYVMEFKQGRIFDNALQAAEPARRTELLLKVVRTLAELHSKDIGQLGLDDFGRQGGFYERQIRTMTRTTQSQVEAGEGKVAPIPRLDELLEWFATHMPVDRCTVMHGDYKPDNVVFAPDDDTVVAVLDWCVRACWCGWCGWCGRGWGADWCVLASCRELSTLGHPLADLANVCLPYYFKPGAVYPSFETVRYEGIPDEEVLMQAYADAAGLELQAIRRDWSYCVAFSLFRLSVIIQGIAARAVQGTASSEAATGMLGMLPQLLEEFSSMWWGVIDSAGQSSAASKL
jgi:aminoglycoside phosphotransferase (APT) family kinase protein